MMPAGPPHGQPALELSEIFQDEVSGLRAQGSGSPRAASCIGVVLVGAHTPPVPDSQCFSFGSCLRLLLGVYRCRL